jgi:2-dehydro-3-deoxy-D-arabinonate dehydratase
MQQDHVFLVQYKTPTSTVWLGLEQGEMLYSLNDPSGRQLDWLLSSEPTAPRAQDFLAAMQSAVSERVDRSTVTMQTPVSQQEVWAAGVTYKRSEEAREAESNQSMLYTRVYNAARPELFFKSMGYDVVRLGDPVAIRYDAHWSVPEPELVVVLNAHMEVIGFTIGNDMSSRDIEGENPLYLPQAKVYDGACALGPRVWLQPGLTSWPDLTIELWIERAGEIVFHNSTTTASIHRPLSELIDYLGRCKRYPYGVMLFTGTGIVPPDTFTLAEGDTVRIRIDPIGELVNTVSVVGKKVESN